MEKSRRPSMAETTKSTITNIPQDHLFSILLRLPIESILCLGMTCKKLKSLAYSDSLWESICTREWGRSQIDALESSNHGHHAVPWMKLYQQVRYLDSAMCRRLIPKEEIVPKPRASHSLNLVSRVLVLFGGGCEGGRHLDDTWIAYTGDLLSIRTPLQWLRVSSGIPSGRFGHSSVVIGNCVVLFGGINDHGIRQNDTWIGHLVFDQTSLGFTFSWRLLDVGSTAPQPRGAHAGCSIDDQNMLIHGGIGHSGLRLGDTWVLRLSEDLCSGTWTKVETSHACPSSRSGHTLTHVGGARCILFGGRGPRYQVLDDVWLLDPIPGSWEWAKLYFEMGDIPHGFSLPRVGHSANLVIGRRLLIYGGEDSYRHRKDDAWILDISSVQARERDIGKMWRRLELKGDRPVCRSFHGACADGSGRFLYVCGGMVDGLVKPADSFCLRFDGECFMLDLLQHTSL